MTTLLKWLKDLGAFKLSAVVIAMIGTSAWVYSRVADINPAILQDEWIYSIASRKYSPWAQDLPFDFGNYLFNLIYSSTALCSSDTFYSCVKMLNLVFIQGFAFTLFLVALRFLPFWGAFAFYLASLLSPTSIYASMFLPEPLFFFLVGLTLLAVLNAAKTPTWNNWAVAGVPLGLAGLVKPHAFMAAMAIGIFLIASHVGRKPFWKPLFINVGALAGAFLLVRVLIGLAIAGPKALNVFGLYGAPTSIGQFVQGVTSGTPGLESSATLVGAGEVTAALGLFSQQLFIHIAVVGAILGASFVVIAIALIDSLRSREPREVHQFSVLMFIWLFVLVIAIVLFTGWVTGSGDDHTTRVLLRYYDYLFPMVALAGAVVAFDKEILAGTKSWIRWIAVAPILLVISIAFAGFFGSLTIQIADAPNLAGLVVDKLTIDVTANLMFLTLLVIAFFPKFTIWAMAALIPWTMIATGWQIQDQYRGFRAEESAADKAGHFAATTVPREELDELVVLAESRFDGRVASFWMEENNHLEILSPGAFPVEQLPAGTKWALTVGNIQLDAGEVVSTEPGYQLIKLSE